MRRPNFFIIGAPKCGTTALAQWLSEHPDVFFCPRKEPHFFNVDGLTATGTLREYEGLFAQAGTQRAIGEGSTHYLVSRVALGRIMDYEPAARFIICVRNPLEMVVSLHAERLKQGRELEPSFERAWRLQERRARGEGIPATIRDDPERLQYGMYCRLGDQIERAIGIAGLDRVHCVVLDDLRSDPAREYRKALAFLDLNDDGRREFDVLNARRAIRSPRFAWLMRMGMRARRAAGIGRSLGVARVLRGLNDGGPSREELQPHLRIELRDYFADDVAKLSRLLNRDLSEWLA